jgi:hypothetical protein
MATYSEQAGGLRRVRLAVPVRAWWSRERVWHGEKLDMNVETAYLPDHTSFEAWIFEDGGPADDAAAIDVKKGLELVNNRATVKYDVKWDKKTLGKKLVLHGERFQFFFEVRIEKPPARGRSNLVYVHLDPHRVSG